MTENKHSIEELKQMQTLSLESKIRMTQQRIKAWYEHWDGQVYVSFSGGKDSTVLADIVRNVCGYKDVPLVYVDTGLEYPEVKTFVKQFDGVEILKPKMSFKQVILKYGYPFFSKEVSQQIDEARNTHSEKVRNKRLYGNNGNRTGMLPFKYRFAVLDNDKYEFSHKCCHIMKKNPAKSYEKNSGRKPITGMMAEESTLRMQSWIKNGCNAFDGKRPSSMPMSFWTEQDVLLYIKTRNLPIASVYGNIVEEGEKFGQLTIFDFLESGGHQQSNRLTTTGCDRTGCVYCGYGCHLNNDQRFVRLKQTHPTIYQYIMKPVSEGGLGYKDIIDWINQKGNMNIKY